MSALARSRLTRVLTGTMLTGVGIQLTLVVTGVIMARALGPTDRGHLALLTLVAVIAWTIGQMGLPFAVSYYTARIPAGAAVLLARLRGVYVRQLCLTVVATAIALLILTDGRPGYVRAGAIVVLCVLPAAFIQQTGLATLQGLRAFTSFNLLRLLPTALFAIAAAALFITDAAELISLAIAWGLGTIAAAPITMIIAARRAAVASTEAGADELPTPREALSFGRRSLLGAASPVESYRLDQSAVALFLSPGALGLYVAALAFTNLPRFFGRSIGLVANPYVAKQASRTAALRVMWQFLAISVVVVVPLIVVLWLATPTLVPFFFGDEFRDSVPVVRILLWAALFYSLRRVLSDGARGAGLPGAGSIAEVVAVGTALGLFAILIPLGGLEGAAYALTGSSFVAFAILVGLIRVHARRSTPDAATGPGEDPRAEFDL